MKIFTSHKLKEDQTEYIVTESAEEAFLKQIENRTWVDSPYEVYFLPQIVCYSYQYMMMRPADVDDCRCESLQIFDNMISWNWPTGSLMLAVFDSPELSRKYWTETLHQPEPRSGTWNNPYSLNNPYYGTVGGIPTHRGIQYGITKLREYMKSNEQYEEFDNEAEFLKKVQELIAKGAKNISLVTNEETGDMGIIFDVD